MAALAVNKREKNAYTYERRGLGMKEDTNKERIDFEPSLENYICDKYSICREERQYVVFLYNILRKYGEKKSRENGNEISEKAKKIFNACGLEETAVVESVFYEAAFLRDFFERNRRLEYSKNNEKWKDKLSQKTFTVPKEEIEIKSFNKELIHYVCKRMCKEQKKEAGEIKIDCFKEEYNLGVDETKIKSKKIKIDNRELDSAEENWIKSRVKWMMNAQPDLAILYHNESKENDQRYLLFIECKFTSKESSYSYPVKEGKVDGLKQRQVQWMIADFLCEYLCKNKKEELKLSSGMEEDKSRLVRFVRSSETKVVEGNDKELFKGEISIEDLIEVDKNTFDI